MEYIIKDSYNGVDIIAFSKNKNLYQKDPSFIYRCMNLASVLQKDNVLNFIGHVKDYKANEKTKIVILHRPVYSFSLLLLLRRLKNQNIKIIADVDDLIIHPDFSRYSPAVINKILTDKKVSKQFNKNFKALKLCDHLTCSTSKLKGYLNQFFIGVPVTVLHNCIFNSWAYGPVKYDSSKSMITYFPGTKSHDRDFRVLRRPLENFINDNENISLTIVGPLNTTLNIRNKQLNIFDKVPFNLYEQFVKDSTVNLAPLEDTIFNDCKSALKAIEAGAFGTPTIFSMNEDASRFSDSSVLIAKTENDWYNHLNTLFDNTMAPFNKSLCFEDTMKKADIQQVTDKFYLEVLDYKNV